MRKFASIVFAAAAIAGSRGEPGAHTFDVFPGPGSPLQSAIDAAGPGDTLRVHSGSYAEAVLINKKLKLKPGEQVFAINAGCGAATALEVVAEHVSVTGAIVRGGTTQTIRVAASHVKLADMGIWSDCSSGDGVRVESSTDVTIRLKNRDLIGWDAGLRLVSLPADARFKFTGVALSDTVEVIGDAPNGVGVVIENSGAGSALGRARIQFDGKGSRGTLVYGRAAGMRLIGSDGTISHRMSYTRFVTSSGIGLELDADSDNNLFVGGSIGGIRNDGAGNCGRGVSPPGVIPECP